MLAPDLTRLTSQGLLQVFQAETLTQLRSRSGKFCCMIECHISMWRSPVVLAGRLQASVQEPIFVSTFSPETVNQESKQQCRRCHSFSNIGRGARIWLSTSTREWPVWNLHFTKDNVAHAGQKWGWGGVGVIFRANGALVYKICLCLCVYAGCSLPVRQHPCLSNNPPTERMIISCFPLLFFLNGSQVIHTRVFCLHKFVVDRKLAKGTSGAWSWGNITSHQVLQKHQSRFAYV